MNVEDKKRRIEELQIEIAAEEKRLADEDFRNSLKKKEDWTNEEKIKFFDQMHDSCMSFMEEIREKRRADDNDSHYMWEALMQGTLGKDVFKVYNKLM